MVACAVRKTIACACAHSGITSSQQATQHDRQQKDERMDSKRSEQAHVRGLEHRLAPGVH